MKRITLYGLGLSGLLLFMNACSNQLDVLGEYKENAVVYAVLDPGQPVQFIKINRVFSNPGASADAVARIPDSLFFDSLTPTLREVETGRVSTLFRANILLKDSGVFATWPNYIYTTKMKIMGQDPVTKQRYTYRLDLYLPKTNRQIYAVTNVPDTASVVQPVTIVNYFDKTLDLVRNGELKLVFRSAPYGKVYDGYFNLNYLEFDKNDTNNKVNKTLRWHIVSNYRASIDEGGEKEIVVTEFNSLFSLMLAHIPVNPKVSRRYLQCSVELTSGNKELDNYIQSQQPAIGIVQKQTDYTNMSNGALGILGAKRTAHYNHIRITNVPQLLSYAELIPLGFVK